MTSSGKKEETQKADSTDKQAYFVFPYDSDKKTRQTDNPKQQGNQNKPYILDDDDILTMSEHEYPPLHSAFSGSCLLENKGFTFSITKLVGSANEKHANMT